MMFLESYKSPDRFLSQSIFQPGPGSDAGPGPGPGPGSKINRFTETVVKISSDPLFKGGKCDE